MSQHDWAISIATLGPGDLPAALELQKEIYPPSLVEQESVFRDRISLEASYCLAARHRERLVGYLLAHGWTFGSPPPLGSLLGDGAPSQVLLIHDLAVSPSSRGLGVGHKLIRRAFDLAARDGLGSAELIAVEGAAEYWRRLGFIEGKVSGALSEKLGTYGPGARWMTRPIPPRS